jgi:predicted nucleic acid-binding protein
MTLYVDSSALLKRYIDEPDSEAAVLILRSDPVLVTSWLTVVEVRRNLARLLDGVSRLTALRSAETDFDAMALMVCDGATCTAAAVIGETLGVRSLDAAHLASAQRLMIDGLGFVTFDLRQGQAARALGLRVLGC